MYRDELLKRIDRYLDYSLRCEVTMLDNRGVIVEGHRGVKKYTSECITLKTRNNYILIEGKNLIIKEINDMDAFIVGEIESVRLSDE